jgi:SNF2 family DNA or RNA helicase
MHKYSEYKKKEPTDKTTESTDKTKPKVGSKSLTKVDINSTITLSSDEDSIIFIEDTSSKQSEKGLKKYNYKEKLELLSKEILEELAKKPDMDRQTYTEIVKPPKGLKINLYKHEVYALLWLKWRESTYPHGAILADDMGIGKTLIVLCFLKLIIDEREAKQKVEYEKQQMKNDDDDDDNNNENNDLDEHSKKHLHTKNKNYRLLTPRRLKTLIVLPANQIRKWQSEIYSCFEPGSFKYHVYHRNDRNLLSYNMEDNDIVFTTYDIVTREMATDTDGNLIVTVS